MNKRILSIFLAITLLLGMIAPSAAVPVQAAGETLESYANVINQVSNGFSDNGVWMKYWLHSAADTAKFGGFPGPKLMRANTNLCSGGTRIVLADESGTAYDLSQAEVTVTSYPGRLVHTYSMNGVTLTLTLICITDRSAMVHAEIRNDNAAALTFKISKTGTYSSGTLTAGDDLLTVTMGTEYFDVHFDRDAAITVSGSTFTADLGTVTVGAGESASICHTESYVFTSAEKAEELALTSEAMADPDAALDANRARWEGYIEKINAADLSDTIAAGQHTELEYKRAAVKAIMILTGNYRSAAGKLYYGGHQPFGDSSVGFWAWDSWKHVVATSSFDPERAKEELRGIYSYQVQADDATRPQDEGAIVDVINYYGINNDRDSKPPFSGWAIYNYYEKTGDLEFLEEMYPKLAAYHQWWYTNRDIDGNGIAEFGAMQSPTHYSSTELDEDGDPKPNVTKILEAAAWESGMDNATRFDVGGYGADDIGIVVYKVKNAGGEIIGYTINQESVDLNAQLYAEKVYLAEMADLLGKPEDAARYEAEAEAVRDYINHNMYDPVTGCYYDLQTNADGSVKKLLVNRGKGTETWLPLWAGLATPAQAQTVVQNMLDENVFYTTMPFPTAAKDNPKYAPTQYWRGPVWMDQAMFAVEALHNYGYHEEAEAAAYKLFDNADGLLTDGTIRENYNPETGGGLSATNFGWSSAAFYNLFINTLSGERTTTAQKLAAIPADDPDILESIQAAEVTVIRYFIENAIITGADDYAEAQEIKAKYDALSDDLKAMISADELAALEEKIGLAESIYNGEISVYLADQSANGYHVDASVTNNKQSITMVGTDSGLALKGWFELNQDGAQELFTDVVSGGFTIEAVVELDRSTGFSYIAGKCDDCFGLRTEGSGMTFYIYNGSTWKNARLTLVDSDYDAPAHVVASCSGGTMKLWVNGRETTTTGAGSPISNSKCLALGIGEYDDGKTADYHNAHTFHSFRVYSGALTPDDLETITPADESVELWYDFDELTYSGSVAVTLDPDNGEAPYTVDAALNMKLATPAEPEKKGYVFRGWYLGDEKWDFANDIVAGEMTLTAKWYREGTEDPDNILAMAIEAAELARQAAEDAAAAQDIADRAAKAAEEAVAAAEAAKVTVAENKESAVAAQAAAEAAQAAAVAAQARAEAAKEQAVAAETAARAAEEAAEDSNEAAVQEALNAAQSAASAAESEANAAASAESAARSAASAAQARQAAQEAQAEAEAAQAAAEAAEERAEAAEAAAKAAAESAAEDRTAAEAARIAAEDAKQAAAEAAQKAQKAADYAIVCGDAAIESEAAAAASNTAAAAEAKKAADAAARAAAAAAEATRQSELIAQYAAGAAEAQRAAQAAQADAEAAQKAAEDAADQTEADRIAAETARKEAEKAAAAARAAAELESARQKGLSDIMVYVSGVEVKGLSDIRVEAFNDAVREAAQAVRNGENAESIADTVAAMKAKTAAIAAGNPFTDVTEEDWFFGNVEYVSVNGYMVGMEETLFMPGYGLTRGQFATILHRLEGAPEVAYSDVFSDVPEGKWYSDAILWANASGIVLGYDNGAFGVNDPITREQLVVMLQRYVGEYKGLTLGEGADLDAFADGDEVSDYARDAMSWAVSAGLIQGSSDPDGLKLDPAEGASRAQCAAIIERFLSNILN